MTSDFDLDVRELSHAEGLVVPINTPPLSPAIGSVWMADDGKIFVWKGEGWVQVSVAWSSWSGVEVDV